MPYGLRFVKSVEATEREEYINDCCIGGDVVLAQLLPTLESRYGDLQSNQEDWGWFAGFAESGVELAVDVFANDAEADEFQTHLTSRKRRLFGSKIEDTVELETLRELVVSRLEAWPVAKLEVEHVNEKYRPI